MFLRFTLIKHYCETFFHVSGKVNYIHLLVSLRMVNQELFFFTAEQQWMGMVFLFFYFVTRYFVTQQFPSESNDIEGKQWISPIA